MSETSHLRVAVPHAEIVEVGNDDKAQLVRWKGWEVEEALRRALRGPLVKLLQTIQAALERRQCPLLLW